ncbi:MAG TPA: hypothetical protein VEX15_10655 [Nocardioidaceae bacterium]|nr:hypothetical protein [Nocardioidaceae bacterium]
MTETEPRSDLPGGAQDGGDGIHLDADLTVALDENYPDPDGDSEELEVGGDL